MVLGYQARVFDRSATEHGVHSVLRSRAFKDVGIYAIFAALQRIAFESKPKAVPKGGPNSAAFQIRHFWLISQSFSSDFFHHRCESCMTARRLFRSPCASRAGGLKWWRGVWFGTYRPDSGVRGFVVSIRRIGGGTVVKKIVFPIHFSLAIVTSFL